MPARVTGNGDDIDSVSQQIDLRLAIRRPGSRLASGDTLAPGSRSKNNKP
jgi:hypothetical protein